MRTFVLFAFITLGLAMWGCSPEKPVAVDGKASLRIAVFDTTGILSKQDPGQLIPVSGAEVVLTSREYHRNYRQRTNAHGIVRFDGLLASAYSVAAYYPVDTYLNLAGSASLHLGEISVSDTLWLYKLPTSRLLITEIYYSGNLDNNRFDQFIEIYNRTDSTVYLDGMILAKVATDPERLPDPESVDFVRANQANRFPGIPGGHTVPILPGEHIVVAVAAANHHKLYPYALDLSNAEFEFHNPLGYDYDDPDVPNVENIIPTNRRDFQMNMKSGAIVLSDGRAGVFTQNYNEEIDKVYFDMPIGNIIDGVEYKQNSEIVKFMNRRVDGGYTGVGVSVNSGKSIERIYPDKDSNNSNVDFQILDTPTPGQ